MLPLLLLLMLTAIVSADDNIMTFRVNAIVHRDYPGRCYCPVTKFAYLPGKSWSIPGLCEHYHCSMATKDRLFVKVAGCHYDTYTNECPRVGDIFPDCCSCANETHVSTDMSQKGNTESDVMGDPSITVRGGAASEGVEPMGFIISKNKTKAGAKSYGSSKDKIVESNTRNKREFHDSIVRLKRQLWDSGKSSSSKSSKSSKGKKGSKGSKGSKKKKGSRSKSASRSDESDKSSKEEGYWDWKLGEDKKKEKTQRKKEG